jgi:hypothetical protein
MSNGFGRDVICTTREYIANLDRGKQICMVHLICSRAASNLEYTRVSVRAGAV